MRYTSLCALALALTSPAALSLASQPAAAQTADEGCRLCPVSELIERLGLEEAPDPVSERPGWSPPHRIVVLADPDRVDWLGAAAPGVELIAAPDIESAVRAVGSADALIGSCSARIVAAAPKLKWIQVPWAGVERCVAIPALAERDILLTNAQRVYAPQIAEHVMAMAFTLARGLNRYMDEQRKGRWNRGAVAEGDHRELDGKALLVVGLGGIGTEVARLADAIGMRVSAIRRSRRAGPEFVSYVGLPDELHKLAGEADIVVNATPLTPETTDLFDAEFFAAMKPTAYFINVGRGKSVVTADLVAALREGEIAGAGLDVTDPEPLPGDHPLWRLPDVLITPHAAASSDLADERLWLVMRENLRRYVAGERMLSVVNVERGY